MAANRRVTAVLRSGGFAFCWKLRVSRVSADAFEMLRRRMQRMDYVPQLPGQRTATRQYEAEPRSLHLGYGSSSLSQ